MDDLDRMRELKQQGFFCSQILMTLGLELQGKENPELIRAMNGLAGGLGFTGETCGALDGRRMFAGRLRRQRRASRRRERAPQFHDRRFGEVVQSRLRAGIWRHSLRNNPVRRAQRASHALPDDGRRDISKSERVTG